MTASLKDFSSVYCYKENANEQTILGVLTQKEQKSCFFADSEGLTESKIGSVLRSERLALSRSLAFQALT